jgi:capsule polysaccharide export protein KpsC/LpsZ
MEELGEDNYLADYDQGFEARMQDQPCDIYATRAWRCGWQEADESFHSQTRRARCSSDPSVGGVR